MKKLLLPKLLLPKLLLLLAGCTAWLSPARAETPWHPAPGPLMTRWAKDVSPANARPEYPRPQMTRPRWQNLNGLWDYAVTGKSQEAMPASPSGQILVPYPIESALSGVRKAFTPEQKLWYHRTFTVPADWRTGGQRVLLHFDAADWETGVTVNGKSFGMHRGGYDAFQYDITPALRDGANDLAVSVTDPTNTSWQLRGKQDLHPGGAAYTATSGLWQTVWLEPVAASSIDSLHLVPDLAAGVLHVTVSARITPHPMSLTVTARDKAAGAGTVSGPIGAELTPEAQEQLVGWYKATNALVTTTLDVPLPNAHLWTPADPYLYTLQVTLKDADGTLSDTVGSYFGMRSVGLGRDARGNTRLLLNGTPTVLAGVLDQGFWPDGIYTAPTDAALKYDIEAARTLGLNALRKHIKIEPERWYYWCDTLGMLVLQDLPAGYAGDSYTDRPVDLAGAAENQSEFERLITQRENHPSIISWNMFNEGWGQFDTVRIARWAKALDPSRLIDEASGFPRHGAGDVLDVHGGVPPRSATQISISSETAGNGLAVPGHAWPGTAWAAGTYDPKTGGEGDAKNGPYPIDPAAKAWYTRSVRGLYRDLWAHQGETGATGYFKVQLTDVENETNGLLSYDRAVMKVDPDTVARAARGEGLPTNITYLIPTALVQPTAWRYVTTLPAADWLSPGFRDDGWKTGLSAFGTGADAIHTPWTDTPGDIWLRRAFTLKTVPKRPQLRLVHDEGVEVYLNGVLACRDGGFISAYDDFAIDPRAAATLKPGKNVIAVHCHQTTGGQAVDVGLIDGPLVP